MHSSPVLMFPTHYLGNFILGLPWVLRVAEEYPELTLVIDARFRTLTDTVNPSIPQSLVPAKTHQASTPNHSFSAISAGRLHPLVRVFSRFRQTGYCTDRRSVRLA